MSKKYPIVTVLFPVYNGEEYLREAIESIINQTYRDYEFLIINDGSTDNSLNYIKSYQDARITVINNDKNIGLVRTLNKGLGLAKGRYIARFDQDDISLPNRLKKQVEFLENNENISAVCSWMYTINSEGRKIRDFRERIENYGDFIGIILLGRVPLYHPAVMFRKDVVLKLNGYDNNMPMAEDYDLWSRMALKKLDVRFILKYHVLQRSHNARATNVNLVEYLNAGIKVQEKTVKTFCRQNHNKCLAALLRLDKDPCGRKYNKNHLKYIFSLLNILFENINKELSLTKIEIKSFKKIIYKRLGLGVRCGNILAKLPSIFFYPIFYLLSPFLIPNLYSSLGKVYRKFQRWYYRLIFLNK